MKKWRAALAMLLALAMLTAVGLCEEAAEADAAQAAAEQGEVAPAWREGLGPQKPYSGVPEVDLSERLGYMIFYPSEMKPAENDCSRLYVYLPREDVRAGKGRIFLCTEEDGLLWSTAMNDESAVEQHTLSAAELNSLLWGSGTCFEIRLPKSLELGKHYFVNMERGGIVTEKGSVDSPEVGGTDTWAFSVEGDYGVSGMEYRAKAAEGADAAAAADAAEEGGAMPAYPSALHVPAAGDEILFDLTLGGDAATAVIYGYNGTVDFPVTMFNESAQVTGEVLGESPAWGVMFLDAEGNELHRTEFY